MPRSSYRRLLQTGSDDPRIVGRLCHVLVMQEQFENAVEMCRRAAQLAPGEAGTFQNIGYSLSRLGKHAEAIDAYQKAIGLAPNWPPPYFGIATAELRCGTGRGPPSITGWWSTANLRIQRRGRHSVTPRVSRAKRRMRLPPIAERWRHGAPNATLYRSLGWQLYRDGRMPDAERALVEANRLNPRDVSTLVSLGVVAEKLGKLSEAKQAWQRASELDPAGATGSIARQNLAALATQAPPAIPPRRCSWVRPWNARAPNRNPRRGRRPPPRHRRCRSAPAAGTPTARPAPPSGAQAGRLKVAIAVGDFQVKAANAGQYIGDGLREMLVTALHGNGNFIVLERMDLKGLAAEQALSRSRMARPGEALPEGQMDVAEIMVYGAVTEFEPEARGGGLNVGLGNIPLTLGVQSKAAHMAIDMRVVDVASGRVLATGRVSGEAQSAQASIGANISARGTSIPVTLGGFQNTPMEQAIRECIGGATAYVVNNTPPQYFRHR